MEGTCPFCAAPPGHPCVSQAGTATHTHVARMGDQAAFVRQRMRPQARGPDTPLSYRVVGRVSVAEGTLVAADVADGATTRRVAVVLARGDCTERGLRAAVEAEMAALKAQAAGEVEKVEVSTTTEMEV